jgi:hypothetical protein
MGLPLLKEMYDYKDDEERDEFDDREGEVIGVDSDIEDQRLQKEEDVIGTGDTGEEDEEGAPESEKGLKKFDKDEDKTNIEETTEEVEEPLEEQVEQIQDTLDSIEKQIKEVEKLGPNSPEYKKLAAELQKKINSITTVGGADEAKKEHLEKQLSVLMGGKKEEPVGVSNESVNESAGFSQYNITLEDIKKKRLDEGWFDKDEDGEFLHKDEYSNDGIKKDVKRIISFLTPGEGDEIEGKYMDNIYPAMALQTAEILYGKL